MGRPGRPKKIRPTVSPSVDAFLDMLVAERGAAANTRDAYEHDLTEAAAWLSSRAVVLDDAGGEDLRA